MEIKFHLNLRLQIINGLQSENAKWTAPATCYAQEMSSKNHPEFYLLNTHMYVFVPNAKSLGARKTNGLYEFHTINVYEESQPLGCSSAKNLL